MAENNVKVDEQEKVEATNATPENNGEKQLPAEGEKKGFHPIQWVKEKKEKFVEEHPVAARRIGKAKDIGTGIVIGGAVMFGTLAAIGKAADGDSDEDYSDLDLNPVDDDPDVIDMPENNDQ